MFERQVLGEDYWAKQAATHPILYPSGAPTSDALVRGEISIAPLLYNTIYPKQKDGAPIKIFFAPEGVPINPYATGIPKTAAHPNAAKLFLNWCLSQGRPDLHDQGARQPHLAEGAAGLSRRLRSQGGQGLVAELRAVREAAARLGRAIGTRPSAIGSERCVEFGQIHDGNARGHRPAQAVRDRPAGGRRRQLRRAGRRDRGAARALRLRQDHDLALRRGPRTSDRRRDLDRRPGRVVARARHAGAAALARHRHGVPVLRGVAAHDGAAERGLSAEAPEDVAQRTPAARSTRRWSWSACPNMPTGRWCRCRAARCSAWRWRAASSTGRSCCCSTSRLSNLDAKLRLRLRDDLRLILKQTGMTALYVTHDQAEAVVLGDRIGVMRDGKLLQMASPDEIYNRPADLFVANFTGATNELAGHAAVDATASSARSISARPARRGGAAAAARSRRQGARSRCGRRTSRWARRDGGQRLHRRA